MPTDQYPNEQDLVRVAAQYQMDTLSAQNLHTYNKRLAIDSWSSGMVGLLMLFGKRPFVDLTVYETIPAV